MTRNFKQFWDSKIINENIELNLPDFNSDEELKNYIKQQKELEQKAKETGDKKLAFQYYRHAIHAPRHYFKKIALEHYKKYPNATTFIDKQDEKNETVYVIHKDLNNPGKLRVTYFDKDYGGPTGHSENLTIDQILNDSYIPTRSRPIDPKIAMKDWKTKNLMEQLFKQKPIFTKAIPVKKGLTPKQTAQDHKNKSQEITQIIKKPETKIIKESSITTNSIGNPISNTPEGIEKFWNWFGNSKAVDAQGRPLVVYHGTFKDFENFDISLSNPSQYTQGIFFTERKDVAQLFGNKIKECYIKAEIGMKEYRKNKSLKKDHIRPINDDRKIWIVFSNDQIKSINAFNATQQSTPTIIKESYTNSLMNFLKYLKAGINAEDFSHLIESYYQHIEEDVPDSYDPDNPYDFFQTEDFKNIKDDFIEKIKYGELPDTNDATSPTYLFLTDAKLVPRNTWLIHFTDEPYDIARNGFIYGKDDYTQLGLTTHFVDRVRKSEPGWNFAFIAGSRDMHYAIKGRHGKPKYGRHAVLFQSAGVVAYHSGDEEKQVMFWGPMVEKRHPIIWDPDNDVWTVAGTNLYSNENIDDVIHWIIDNERQMGPHILGTKKMQPTPKKDREQLYKKLPTDDYYKGLK